MTYVRAVAFRESGSLERDGIADLIQLSSDRTDSASGGFLNNWDAEVLTGNVANTPNPFNLIWYRARLYTSVPCVLYSSEVETLNLAKTAPAGVDTTFNQLNLANKVIKKWTTTSTVGNWSFLKAGGSRKKPLSKLDNSLWKVQLKNIDPHGGDAYYYGIVEFGLEYDAVSSIA